MGVSTDAYLVYGFDLGAEEDWDEDDHLRKLTEMCDNCEMDDEKRVELVDHCSGEYRMWILAVKGAIHRARRGYPTKINPDGLQVTDKKIAGLRAFCDEHKIKWKEPKWLLCSMWN